MPNGRGSLVRLTDERLRRLERRMAAVEEAQRGTKTQLDQAVDVLTRIVRIVAAQNQRLKKNFAQLTERVDRLAARSDRVAKAIVTGRSTDVRRVSALERRMAAIERRLE